MLTVIICDIHEEVIWQINQIIRASNKDRIKTIKNFKTEESALFYIEDHKEEKHIAFIDVEFDSGKGITFASKIKQLQKNVSIVFMSEEHEYNPRIYDVEHVFFLPKPLNKKLLNESLVKSIVKQDEYNSQYLVAVTKSDVSMIPLKEIIYIEKEKRKVHVIDSKGLITSYYSCFDEIQKQLNNDFYRCHNSYIINIQKVTLIDSSSAKMNNGRNIPVSRSHLKELKSRILGLASAKEIV